jgi:translocation and assembly module TamA
MPSACPYHRSHRRVHAKRWYGLALLLLTLVIAAPASAVRLKVEVTGVDADEEKNVLALLAIYQERKDDLPPLRLVALHRQAPDQIREALAPFGYYRVEVSDSLAEPAEEGGLWIARYAIKPGEPVKIAEVDYQVLGPGADDPAFPKTFGMKQGDVLLHADYEEAKSTIVSAASELGYLNAELALHQVLIDPVAYNAVIQFHVDTGPRYYFGRVRFKQDLLADAFLQRFVPFAPGDLYDPDQLLALQSRLLGAEYFSKVEIVPLMEEASASNQVPIEVIAERNQANKYRIGVGYGTDVGPRLSFDYRRRYIGRWGHKLETQMQLSERLQALVLKYRIPIGNSLKDYVLIQPEAYAYDTPSRQGTVAKVGIAHSTVIRGDWRREIGIDFRYEDYEVADEQRNTFTGLVPHIAFSKVKADDPINTRNGYRVKAQLKGTAAGLAPSSWLSGSLGVKWIKSLGDEMRLISRADLGATWAASLDDVPASERFYAGGDNSIRGWDYEVLGPNDPVTNRNLGGRMLAVGSLELERQIIGNWGLAVFTDFGNAFDPDYSAEWEQSAGLGLRYQTPVGPVRVDAAYALTKDDPGVRLHLLIGPDL